MQGTTVQAGTNEQVESVLYLVHPLMLIQVFCVFILANAVEPLKLKAVTPKYTTLHDDTNVGSEESLWPCSKTVLYV